MGDAGGVGEDSGGPEVKIVVTGSSSGIGKTIAEHLRACGHEVFGISRSEGFDVTNLPQMRALALVTVWNRPDVLICCAGIINGVFWEVLRTNLGGTENCLTAFKPKRAICMAGGGAPKPLKGHLAYSVSKTAVIALVESYALENPYCVINALAPGFFKTPLTAHLPDQEETDPALLLRWIDWLLTQTQYSGKLFSVRRDNIDALLTGLDSYKVRRNEA